MDTTSTSAIELINSQLRSAWVFAKLADEHSLEFQLSLSSDKTLFHAEIHGEGFHITSDPVVGSPREISTVFFIDYHEAPTSTSLETVDELSNELKSLLSEIPNVTITEEK